jgi:hypothetical protein
MGDIVLAGATSGTITLQPTAVAGSSTLTLPAANATVLTSVSAQSAFPPNIAGNGPAFRAKPSTNQSVTSGVYTKVTLGTEDWDTNNNFASSRFTPTVAGYYFINGALYATFSGSATYIWALIYKNGVSEISGNLNVPVQASDGIGIVNGLVYLNGSTDYVELYCYLSGTSPSVSTSANTQFSGFLARSA